MVTSPTREIRSKRPLAMCLVALALASSVACKKKDDGARAPASTPPASRNAPSDISYLPQGIFGPDAVPGATVLKPVDIHSLSNTELKYGIAPKRTSNVEYQPEVIVMEQGDRAVRSISSNGMEWEFDASAEHVSEFQEGKIVFATSRAVGRIISLKKEGGSVKAILGPIQLTDVIRNGKFKMDSPVSAENMISYVAPDFPREPDPQPHTKTTSRFEPNPEHVERAVVVSLIDKGVWTPMSVAQTYPDGKRASFQRVGNRWLS